MTVFQVHFNNVFGANYGIQVTYAENVAPITDEPSEFPQVGIGHDPSRWPQIVGSLFTPWATGFHRDVTVQVDANGICSAWLVPE